MSRGSATRICILGAGAAGLSVAHYLRQYGFRDLTVLEKEREVGGKCLSVEAAPGLICELGAILVFPCYRRVHELLSRFGIQVELLPPYRLVDPARGEIAPTSWLYPRLGLSFFKSLTRYLKHRPKMARYVDNSVGFSEIASGQAGEALCQPFSDWLRMMGYSRLEQLFHVPVTNYGYGYLDEIPAAYALKYMRPELLSDFISHGTGRPHIGWLPHIGYQGLMRAMALDLERGDCPVRIRSGLRNLRIERGDTIWVRIGDEPAESFDVLILGTQDVSSLSSVMQLDPEEEAIFARVRYNHYVTVLAESEGVAHGGYGFNLGQGASVVPPPSVCQMLAPSAHGGLLLLYGYARDADLTAAQLVHRAETTVHLLGGRIGRVLAEKTWKYFPHFDSAALLDGWADRLRCLQPNRRRTFYVGGLLGFETVEDVLAVSHRVVEAFFAPFVGNFPCG